MSWLSDTIDELHAAIPESEWDALAEGRWIGEMYRAVDFMMRNAYWNAVRGFMLQLQTEKPERMIAFLRFTSNAKDHIVGWEPMVRIVESNLRAEGKDAERMLRGLIAKGDHGL